MLANSTVHTLLLENEDEKEDEDENENENENENYTSKRYYQITLDTEMEVQEQRLISVFM
jgi:hypothetical protein